jgi:DNA-binding NarL/FixJ family response regulator
VVLFAILPPAEVQAVYESGVRGCVPKTAPPELFTAALKLVLAGGLYFSDFGEIVAKPSTAPGLRSRLSVRQLEVLKLIEIGQTNKEIAKALGISVATVKLHVQAILNITGARNRTEAALRARGQIR